MKMIFSPPSLEDVIRLLKAWRFWILAACAGALIAAAVYYIVPPPYRARSTVLVDFNMEEAWPQDTDRQQFYYLERESRKLEEVAWSDSVLQSAANQSGTSVAELRAGILTLSQPAEGGWHFYADSADSQRAADIASAWSQSFVDVARQKIGAADGLNSFIEVEVTQSADVPSERETPLSSYLLAGALIGMFLGAFGVLFFAKK